MKLTLSAAILVLWTVLAGPAFAQSEQSIRVRGTIDAANAQSLAVTTNAGDKLTLAVPVKLLVMSAGKASLAAIKPGSFVGVAAQTQPDGSSVALEVHVFSASLRGLGVGSRPWDQGPNSTMTNGNVGSAVGTSGRTLTVQYPGGEKTIQVPKTVPVVLVAKGSSKMLKPGRKVIIAATRSAAGDMTMQWVIVGKPGVTPPM
jgi:hypothetical protein